MNHNVFCTLTSSDNVTIDATPEQFGDILLQLHDMWDNDSPVVGMRKTYKLPHEPNPTTGTPSAYTTETCPTCKRVYSGADITSHLRTHNRVSRKVAHEANLRTKADTAVDVSKAATRRHVTYMTESEGLMDTCELTDAHVRESGKYLSVEVITEPTHKCAEERCMQLCDESILVTKKWTPEGSSYSCIHGTHWNEVWEVSHTHARWDHLRDAHLHEMQLWDNAGLSGSNPYYTYQWRQKHTRVERMRQILTWVANAHYGAICKALKEDVLKVRRNATVAAAVGFKTTPKGKWDGVSFDPTKGFIRTYEDNGVQVTRYPDWSGLYLTRKDMDYINRLMLRRVGR